MRMRSDLGELLARVSKTTGATKTSLVEAALSAYFGLNGAGNGASAGKG